ncbi:MAG: hypothetical protein V1738_00650 [Patescibacteria group bacterium]
MMFLTVLAAGLSICLVAAVLTQRRSLFVRPAMMAYSEKLTLNARLSIDDWQPTATIVATEIDDDPQLVRLMLRGSTSQLLRTTKLFQVYQEQRVKKFSEHATVAAHQIDCVRRSHEDIEAALSIYNTDLLLCLRNIVRVMYDLVTREMMFNLSVRKGVQDELFHQLDRERTARANLPWEMFPLHCKSVHDLADKLSTACESLNTILQWLNQLSFANTEQAFADIVRTRSLLAKIERLLGAAIN